MSWTIAKKAWLVCIIGVLLNLLSFNAHARLYESPTKAKTRYGAPIKESSVIMVPLLKDTKELRYHHHGWRVRSAYVKDQAVIISYMKLAQPSTPDSILQKDEIQAILNAEAGGYRWMKVKRGSKITNSKKYQGYFNISSKVWKRGDGAVAWVSGNSALSVISKEGLDCDIQLQVQKENQGRSNITNF